MADSKRRSSLFPAALGVGGLGAAGLGIGEAFDANGKLRRTAKRRIKVPVSNAKTLEQEARKKFLSQYKPEVGGVKGTGLTGMRERFKGIFAKSKGSLRGETAAQVENKLRRAALKSREQDWAKYLEKEQGRIGYRVRRGANEALTRTMSHLKRNPKAWIAGGAAAALVSQLLRNRD